jgi:carbon-monoxide dehydrogenase small subunit
MKSTVKFNLNDEEVQIEVEHHWTLLQLLRDYLGLGGVKEGCGVGECGACTVIIDGETVNSCIFPVLEVEGKNIITIEGLADKSGVLHPLQKAFVEQGAVQCGFCTPGMILSAKALLDRIPNPTEDEIKTAISGNLCRCTGYVQIIEAIRSVCERNKK